ncbi:MAG TPA: hypothetical protein VF733_00930 [Candidatus Saccharimonadales bacterium]
MKAHYKNSPFQLEGVDFYVGDPDEMSPSGYMSLYALAQASFAGVYTEMNKNVGSASTPPLPDEALKAAAYLLGGSRQSFELTRRDPLQLNDRLDNPEPLSYSSPTLVVARKSREIIGYAYAANVTSGSRSFKRQLKMRGTAHKYAWLREVVAAPNAPNGIGTTMAALLMEEFDPRQPASAYTWRGNDVGEAFVSSLGFTTDIREKAREVQPFGALAGTFDLIRWTASVSDITSTINKKAQESGSLDMLERARALAAETELR